MRLGMQHETIFVTELRFCDLYKNSHTHQKRRNLTQDFGAMSEMFKPIVIDLRCCFSMHQNSFSCSSISPQLLHNIRLLINMISMLLWLLSHLQGGCSTSSIISICLSIRRLVLISLFRPPTN